jgi:outer membrane protein
MKKVSLLAVLFSMCSFFSYGQKTGHINGQELIEHMPEYKKAYDELNIFKQQFEDQLKDMENKYKVMVSEFEAKSQQPMNEVIKNQMIRNIEDQRNRIYEFQEMASNEVAKEEQNRVRPILEKAKTTIEKVAKANGYNYILDSSTGVLLYLGGTDITPLVCAELGIPDYTKEEAPKPAAPGTGTTPSLSPAGNGK